MKRGVPKTMRRTGSPLKALNGRISAHVCVCVVVFWGPSKIWVLHSFGFSSTSNQKGSPTQADTPTLGLSQGSQGCRGPRQSSDRVGVDLLRRLPGPQAPRIAKRREIRFSHREMRPTVQTGTCLLVFFVGESSCRVSWVVRNGVRPSAAAVSSRRIRLGQTIHARLRRHVRRSPHGLAPSIPLCGDKQTEYVSPRHRGGCRLLGGTLHPGSLNRFWRENGNPAGSFDWREELSRGSVLGIQSDGNRGKFPDDLSAARISHLLAQGANCKRKRDHLSTSKCLS